MPTQKQLSQWIINAKQALWTKCSFTHLLFIIRQKISVCDLCANPVDTHFLLCKHCLADLPLFRYNLIAGDLLNWPAINKLLPDISFDQLFCLAPYRAPFNLWIMQFKYQGRFELAQLLSDLLIQHFLANKNVPKVSNNAHDFDLILSVPLHSSKWRSRGYNQAHLLAKPISAQLKCIYWPHFLQRTVKNVSQVGHDGKQRRKNLRGVFNLSGRLPTSIKHVLLVDDVVTTGSTASEISKLLKAAGVKQVTVMALSLSLPKNNISK